MTKRKRIASTEKVAPDVKPATVRAYRAQVVLNDGRGAAALGDRVPLVVEVPELAGYQQVQALAVEAGVLNRTSFTTINLLPAQDIPGRYQGEIVTTSLPEAFFEIGWIRFSAPKLTGLPEQIELATGRDFPRLVVALSTTPDMQMSTADAAARCTQRDAEIEAEFAQGIALGPQADAKTFTCFVFVSRLLLGGPIRFARFEIAPFPRGLDRKDQHDLVNEFFRRATKSGLQFEYGHEAMQHARREQPVAIVHFPKIFASSADQVQAYCSSQAQSVLNVLALTRDSKGEAFGVVVCGLSHQEAVMFSMSTPYRGNLVTGQISGEYPPTLAKYLSAVGADSFKGFLLALYAEAIAETNQDFQFLRLWQILELVADSRNYDSNADLLDASGAPILRNGQQVKQRDGAPTVFAVLRDFALNHQNAWENANVWFAFRTAVAHHGSVRNFDRLQRPDVRAWVQVGLDKNRASGNLNVVLMDLQSSVNQVLQSVLSSA